MRILAIACAALLALTLLPPVEAQTCVVRGCPSGTLACVNDACVLDPRAFCVDVVWFDQQVGPYHIWATGCTVHVQKDGRDLLP